MHMCCIVPGYERTALDDEDSDVEEVRKDGSVFNLKACFYLGY